MANKKLLVTEAVKKEKGLKMTMQTLFRLLAPVLFLSILSGCAVSNKFGPYIGKVVDAETKEPIEGAVVFMEATTVTGTLAGATSHYAGFKEVLTDEDGEFHITLRLTALKPGHVWDSHPYISIFKPGYGVFPGHRRAHSNIFVKNTSHILPENTYVAIALPKLTTRAEREDNVLYNLDIHSISEIPFEKYKNLFRLRNIENASIGLQTYSIPK